MKLVVRADDIGYSKVCNIGSFEAIENGIVTSADVMLDTPGTVDALERLRSYPWISVGWHNHFWGSPVLGGNRVPTMYDKERKGFRTDLFTAADVSFDEALAECRAQMELCVKILGKAPDVGLSIAVNRDTPFGRAIVQVNQEYGLVTDYMGTDFGRPSSIYAPCSKWADRKIFVRGLWDAVRVLKTEPLSDVGWTDSILALLNYDPIRFYTEDESGLLKVTDDSITLHAWHPGYVDYYVYRHGDYTAPSYCFKDIRTVDVHALCSDEVKNWIAQNHVELVNLRDALYGTTEYQNHLRANNSPLAV